MDELRVGRTLRVLRHRLGWRQCDVARVAQLTQDDISRGERGGMRDLRKLRRHGAALDADVYLSVKWRGGEIDRLLDEGHATIVDWVISTLTSLGWAVLPEVSYSVYGERGSIDVLAWHENSRTLLVVEVKTELTSVEETLRKHDAKQRLAPIVATGRFGTIAPRAVCRMLVLPDTTTARTAVRRHRAVLGAAYRFHGVRAKSWLRNPDTTSSILIFAPVTRGTRGKRHRLSRRRIRVTALR